MNSNYIKRYVPALLCLLCMGMTTPKAAAQNKTQKQLEEYLQACRYATESPRVLKMADSLMQAADRLGYPTLAARALMTKGEYYHNMKDVTNLMRVKNELENRVVHTADEDCLFSLWNRVIDYYLNRYNYAMANAQINVYQQKALELNNTYGRGYVYLKLGDVYFDKQNFRQAIEQYSKGVAYFERCKETTYLPEFYLYISSAYMNLQDYENSRRYVLKAMRMNPRKGPSTLAMLALCNAKMRRMDEARENLDTLEVMAQSYPLSRSTRNNLNAAQCTYCIQQGHYERALAYAQAIENPTLNCLYQKEAYKAMGRYGEALAQAERHLMLHDSLAASVSDKQITEYTAQYDADRLRNERNEQELRRKDQLHLGYQVITALVLLFLVAQTLLLRKMRRERNAAKQATRRMKAAKLEAQQARAAAEQADQLKSVFLQNMSHEIRTPLNAIVGFTTMLNDPEADIAPEERTEFVELVERNSEMLTTLVNDLLDLSRLESGNYDLRFAQVEVCTLCRQTVNSVRGRNKPGVRMAFEEPQADALLPDGTPLGGLTLHTDGSRLRQVLTNFLTNACKYTEHGSITLSLEVRPAVELEVETEVVFAVTDTGCGIDPKQAEKVFNRFEKLDSMKQGTGLGLNICAHIARLLGGQVMLDETYLGGSRFLFVLPLQE